MLNIFQIITLEGWTDMMYVIRDVEDTYLYDAFFLLCVVVGSMVILNLMVAVQSSYLDSAFDEEEKMQQEAQNIKEKREKDLAN